MSTKKIVSLWSDILKHPDAPLKSHFSVSRVIEEKPFKEVSFRDFAGVQHTHLVHTKQIPLPLCIAKDLHRKQAAVLDNFDYEISLDHKKIAGELEANRKRAQECGEEGSLENFNLKPLALTTSSGSIDVKGLLYKTRVDYQMEGEAGVATSTGFRSYMEDEHLTSETCSAVFDGHGGAVCAEHVKKSFLPAFTKWLNDPSLAFSDPELRIYNAINLSFADINRTFLEEVAGSTANVALIIGRELWVINLGDSRAILVTPEKTVQLSVDQKADENRELIEARGAMISWDNRLVHFLSPYSIAPARGFGDHHLKGGMSPRPVITLTRLPKKKGGFLVQACDGVFDVASSKQIGELVRRAALKNQELSQIAALIACRAIERGSEDNITVIIKRF